MGTDERYGGGEDFAMRGRRDREMDMAVCLITVGNDEESAQACFLLFFFFFGLFGFNLAILVSGGIFIQLQHIIGIRATV